MSSDFYKKYNLEIGKFIDNAIDEDIGGIDHSNMSLYKLNSNGTFGIYCNESCVIAGLLLTKKIIERQKGFINLKLLATEGSTINANKKILTLDGPIHIILSIERIILNCLQRMSGIATFTKFLSKKISHTSCKILDTRKTTPNFRYPEKWAVLIGGGYNHRMGLFDSIIIKDTHIDSCGSISKVLEKTKKYIISKDLKIPVIVETRNINEIKECLKFDWIDRILLDNMNVNQIKNALKLINNKIKTEASGNISSKNIVEIAETGVDYISVGALTHSYKSIDFSMKVI